MRTQRRKKPIVTKEETLRYKDRHAVVILIFMNLLPFCVYAHVEELSETAARYFPNTGGYVVDFFLYHKEKLLMIFAIWLILFFIGEHIYPKHPARDIPLRSRQARGTLLCVGVYAAAVMLSAIFAKDRQTAMWGSCTEYEGMVALLSYLVLFLAGYNYFRRNRRRSILKTGLVVFMTVLCVLAAVEIVYKPIYEISFMKYLIAPPQYRELAEGLSSMGFQKKAVLSFYNPGYLGGLCAMLIPISFGFAFEEEKRQKKCCYLLLHAGLWFTLFATGVTGGFLAAVMGMVALAVSLCREKKKLLRTVGLWAVVMFLVFLAGNLMTGGAVTERMFAVAANGDSRKVSEELLAVDEIELQEGKLKVSSPGFTFFMERGVTEQLVLETLKFTDAEGKEIPTELDDGVLHVRAEGMGTVSLTYEDGILSLDLGQEDTVDFYVTEEGFYLVGQNGAALKEIPQPQIQSDFLKKWYPLATGRGYLWVNTLPIVTECLVLGKGPGNFAYVFPQNEVVGLLQTHGSYKFVIDKPHSWYLQMAVSTGMISLVAVLVLLGRYFGRGAGNYCVKNINNTNNANNSNTFEKSLWSGLLAFCIAGLVNDSIVAVNPIFWLLLGVGSCAVDDNKKPRRNQL